MVAELLKFSVDRLYRGHQKSQEDQTFTDVWGLIPFIALANKSYKKIKVTLFRSNHTHQQASVWHEFSRKHI